MMLLKRWAQILSISTPHSQGTHIGLLAPVMHLLAPPC